MNRVSEVEPPVHRICLPARLDQVDFAARWARELPDALGLDASLRFRIDLVLEEALANIAMHAFVAGGDGVFEVLWQGRRDGGVELTIRDNGGPFDPTRALPIALASDLASARPGGLGIGLIRQFTERMDYARVAEHNLLTLTLLPAQDEPTDARLAAAHTEDVERRRSGPVKFPLTLEGGAEIVADRRDPLAVAYRAQLFRGLPQDTIAPLLRDCDRRSLCAGERLIGQGQINHHVYILLSGRLNISLASQGSQVDLFLQQGECVGEMSVIDGEPASANVIAASDVEVLAIHEELFWSRLATMPGVARNLLRIMCQRIRRRNEQELGLLEQQLRYEHLAREMSVAQDIQLSMLPQRPLLEGYPQADVEGLMEPAHDVGGDYFDLFALDENRICLTVGDVSGKGMPAALFMVRAVTLLRSHIKKKRRLEKSLFKINNLLIDNNPTLMFVTALVMIVDLRTGQAMWINAGHCEPSLVRSQGADTDNEVHTLHAPKGLMLGIQPNAEYHVEQLRLRAGDALILYTDGITEAENRHHKQFGEQRLKKHLARQDSLTAVDLVSNLRAQVRAFADGAPASDDITVLAFRYLAGDGQMATTQATSQA